MGPRKAPKGLNTKVTSAKGHFCAYPNDVGPIDRLATAQRYVCDFGLTDARTGAASSSRKHARGSGVHHSAAPLGSRQEGCGVGALRHGDKDMLRAAVQPDNGCSRGFGSGCADSRKCLA